ncbi:hypothetical protein PM082_008758 [Marasmius tenuissimus]|nr:hypothetical protein PM082_008758 [Marasmius tenuissimus]
MLQDPQPKHNQSAMPRTNINHGRDQILGDRVEVNNVGVQQNFATNLSSPRMTHLCDAVAGVGASHLSEQQFDRGLKCLEGTRVEIIRAILDWLASKDWSCPLCWLSGAAGVGKSSIAMTVAKSCEGDGLASSFFFFRPDPKRNNPSAFVLSIAHDLVVRMPFAGDFITQTISKDPTILEATLEDQFQELVFKPAMQRSTLRWLLHQFWLIPKAPSLVIIDGLDECGDEDTQRRILSTIISSYKQSRHFPLRFLICSRPEKWIREAFDEDDFRGLTQHLRLDDEVFSNRDIKRYYLREFKQIRESPQFARLSFPAAWPSPEDLEFLVDKSSGQFVHAATIVKIVKSRGCNPLAQLSSILSYTLDNPSRSFAPIDFLYQMVLSNHPDPEQLVPVLAAIFMLPPHGPSSPEFIELLLGLPTGELDIILRPMHSVLNIRDAGIPIVPFHESFMEFLYDKSRSECFCIDTSVQYDFLAQRWVQALNPVNQPSFFNDWRKRTLWKGWADLCLCVEQPSEKLLSDLQQTDLLAIIINVAITHSQAREELSSIITRPLEAIISWLAPTDSPVSAVIVRHSQDILEQFKSVLMAESDDSIEEQSRGSPYRELHALCYLAFMTHWHSNHYENLRPILTAILALPINLKLSSEWIGLLFDMPPGDVALAWQGMHSILHIRAFGKFDRIGHDVAHHLHIDIPVQRHNIARQWLDGVSAFKMQAYSSDQLYGESTNSFFTEWMEFCTTFTKPTIDLVGRLRGVDFASVYFCKCFPYGRHIKDWHETFEALRSWVLKGDWRVGFTRLEQGLVDKLDRLPNSFHLEQLSGPLRDDDLIVAVLVTSECSMGTLLARNATERYQRQAPLRITECQCDAQSIGNKSGDAAKHLAYQEACTRVVRAYVTKFEVLARTNDDVWELNRIFITVVDSALLQHCRLDTELFSLFNTVFASARGCSLLQFYGGTNDRERLKARLSDWIKTFPESFAQEAAEIKAQVNTLSWDKWGVRILL